jgi:hypothetical protein
VLHELAAARFTLQRAHDERAEGAAEARRFSADASDAGHCQHVRRLALSSSINWRRC